MLLICSLCQQQVQSGPLQRHQLRLDSGVRLRAVRLRRHATLSGLEVRLRGGDRRADRDPQEVSNQRCPRTEGDLARLRPDIETGRRHMGYDLEARLNSRKI